MQKIFIHFQQLYTYKKSSARKQAELLCNAKTILMAAYCI